MLNPSASLDEREDDTAIVRVRVARGASFFERFCPPVMEKRFELDELGTFVTRQIDGRKDVVGIIDAFVERFRVNRREAELGVVSFLKMLTQKGVATVVSPEQAGQ
jgi:hypothetical protein